MSDRHLDTGLTELHQQLLAMGGLAEQAIQRATEAWRLRNLSKVQEVYTIEQKVDQAQIAIDAICFKLLALQQPMATDLRAIIASIKINTDLERIVDLAVNLAQNTEFYLQSAAVRHLDDLSEMADEARSMMKKVLDSFVAMDERMAREVLGQDDKVDGLKNKIFQECKEQAKRDPNRVEQGLNLILMARNLERIADHCTNIAEDVIFAISGKDVRHPQRKQTSRA
ncbi:MAG: phosphate signaling complex protein PhoU [Deltaproteobacteria bacterium]|nr:phosphate signaling complex protein PhoU [Deltaproteobacteria bacterium]